MSILYIIILGVGLILFAAIKRVSQQIAEQQDEQQDEQQEGWQEGGKLPDFIAELSKTPPLATQRLESDTHQVAQVVADEEITEKIAEETSEKTTSPKPRKKEKFNAKKAIIYTEIINPKFKEF